MNIKFIEEPRFISRSSYEHQIKVMIEKLRLFRGIVSIYQIGGITTPGISDIDLVVVFKDGVDCKRNFLGDLSLDGKYLFIHALYGVSQSHFLEAKKYTFFHNYTRLFGEELNLKPLQLQPNNEKKLKIQTALEFLIKMYLVTIIERTYKIVKIRNLLLHIKGLIYDFEFLGILSGELNELVKKMMIWREEWLNKRPTNRILGNWFRCFNVELSNFLNLVLNSHHFYLVEDCNLQILKNSKLIPNKIVKYSHQGFIFPNMLSFLGKRYINIQNRFNRFQIYIPATFENCPLIIIDRFKFFKDMKIYNRKFLPHFSPLVSSLNII